MKNIHYTQSSIQKNKTYLLVCNQLTIVIVVVLGRASHLGRKNPGARLRLLLFKSCQKLRDCAQSMNEIGSVGFCIGYQSSYKHGSNKLDY